MDMIADKSELLHFLKGIKGNPHHPFTDTFLFSIKKEYKNWCPFKNHGVKISENCYELFKYESGWFDYLKQFLVIAKYFANDFVNMQNLEKAIIDIGKSSENSTKDKFKKNLDRVIILISSREKEINHELQKMTCLECKRLGEAIISNSVGCFNASTVMAVSAVEARLHELVKKKNAKIYNKHFKNQTLGTLIKLFDKNEYKDKKFSSLKKILPDRHKSLLDLVNTYRVLSAHPLTQGLDHKVSDSILNLSFLFLLDPELKITNKKLLIHK